MCRSARDQRREQKDGLDHHAEGGADAQEHQTGVVRVERCQAGMGHQGVEPQEDADDHQVVGDGDEHGRGELASGVEQGGEQGDEPVTGQLRDEPTQQEDGLVLLLLHVGVVVGDGVQVDDFGSEEEEGDGGRHQDHDGHGDHGGDGLPGLLAPPGAEVVDEHRDEGGGQDAGEYQVDDHVRRVVGQVVTVGEAPATERHGQGHRATQSGEPRNGGADGHAQGGPRQSPSTTAAVGR